MSPVGAGQGGLHAGVFQQFRQPGGDRRYSTGVAGHRYEFQLPLSDCAGRVGAQPAGRRLDLVGARAVPIHRNNLARYHQAGGCGARPRRYADAITQTASGNYEVRDPTLRSEILKLRNDPNANALMAGAFTRGNASALSERLGRAPSEGELYIAHFLGVGGAARLIGLAGSNPNARAADYFSECRASQPFNLLRSVDRRGPKPRPSARHPHRPL